MIWCRSLGTGTPGLAGEGEDQVVSMPRCIALLADPDVARIEASTCQRALEEAQERPEHLVRLRAVYAFARIAQPEPQE